jgi:hypothetical protein
MIDVRRHCFTYMRFMAKPPKLSLSRGLGQISHPLLQSLRVGFTQSMLSRGTGSGSAHTTSRITRLPAAVSCLLQYRGCESADSPDQRTSSEPWTADFERASGKAYSTKRKKPSTYSITLRPPTKSGQVCLTNSLATIQRLIPCPYSALPAGLNRHRITMSPSFSMVCQAPVPFGWSLPLPTTCLVCRESSGRRETRTAVATSGRAMRQSCLGGFDCGSWCGASAASVRPAG